MYRDFYGLKKKPFELVPDDEIIFKSEGHKEAFSTLFYGVIERKGFIVLTGDVGTGKTTILRLLKRSLRKRCIIAMVSNPTLTIHDFYMYLSSLFKLGSASRAKARFMIKFQELLELKAKTGIHVVLAIDEAHLLSPEMFEEIRLLSNLGMDAGAALTIVLVGQPELDHILSNPKMRALRQRITIRYHIPLFRPYDTRRYIIFRLQKAGARRLNIFDYDAVELVHEYSKGCPRLINILCDHALLSGYAANKIVIDADIIKDSARELELAGPAPQKRKGFFGRLLGM